MHAVYDFVIPSNVTSWSMDRHNKKRDWDHLLLTSYLFTYLLHLLLFRFICEALLWLD